MKNSHKPKVAIIGAGLAGLTIAYRLQQKGYSIDLYEARPRVGGRVHSVLLKNFEDNYSVAELGGQNITDGGESNYFISLAKELNLELIENHMEFSHLFYDGLTFYDPHILLKEQKICPQEVLKKLNSYKDNSITIQDILDALFASSPLLKRIFTFRMAAWEGSLPSKLSIYHNIETLKYMLLGGISPAHQATGYKPLLHLMVIKGGNAHLPLKLAESLEEKVHLNHILKKVSIVPNNKISLTFQDGKIVLCDKLIFAIPCSVYEDIIFENGAIPNDRLIKIKRVQYGTNAKILVPIKYENLTYNAIMTDKMVAFFNGDKKLLNLYYTADSLFNLNDFLQDAFMAIKQGMKGATLLEECPTIAADHQLGQYTNPVVKVWTEDLYAKGSYANYGLDPSLIEAKDYQGVKLKAMFEPIHERIFFVGEHTTVLDEIGTMEAAVESAERISRLF